MQRRFPQLHGRFVLSLELIGEFGQSATRDETVALSHQQLAGIGVCQETRTANLEEELGGSFG